MLMSQLEKCYATACRRINSYDGRAYLSPADHRRKSQLVALRDRIVEIATGPNPMAIYRGLK